MMNTAEHTVSDRVYDRGSTYPTVLRRNVQQAGVLLLTFNAVVAQVSGSLKSWAMCL